MAESSRRWSRNELLLAFELYCKTTFGRLHRQNPDVVALALALNRTPSAIAMKLVNFASLDEAQQARGVKGLSNASKADRDIVDEFQSDWEGLAYEAALIRLQLTGADPDLLSVGVGDAKWNSDLPTERSANVKVRVAQAFFRESVFSTYDTRCAICDIRQIRLLNASHIIPWSLSESRRADPTNGLCLCAIHDRAFDRGLLAIDAKFRVVLGHELSARSLGRMHDPLFAQFDGTQIRLPQRFRPDLESLRFHFETIFHGPGVFNGK